MKKKILLLGIGLALAGCKKQALVEAITSLSPVPEPANIASHLVGKWAHDEMFYCSHITLKEDGSFQYSDKGCLGHHYSAGTWKLMGQELILTSYDTFMDKQNSEVAEAYQQPDSVQQSEVSSANKNENTQKGKPIKLGYKIKLNDLTFNLVNSTPLQSDTTLYLDRQVFIVKNDSLYWLDAQGKEGKAYGKAGRK
jgi:hypothetical protein